MRPCADLFEACGEGLADAAIVHVLHVHDLEAGLVHQPVGVEVRVRRQMRRGHHLRSIWMRVEPAFAVGIHIQLNLADAAVELQR